MVFPWFPGPLPQIDLRTRPVHLRPPRGSRKVPDATRQHWPQGSLLVFGFLAGRPKLICLYCKLIIDSNCIYDIYIIIVVYYNIIHIISNIIFYNTYMIIHVWPWDGMGFTTMLHRPRMNCLFLHCETEHLGYLLSFQHLSPRKMKMFELVEKSNWSQQPEIARHGLETSFSSSR